MTPKIPFFISPAYSDPRITISLSLKLTLIEVVEFISSVYGSAMNSPAFKTVKSGPLINDYFNYSEVSLKSICFINNA